MISIPIQNRVAPLVGALVASLWFAMVAAAILLVVSGSALAYEGQRADPRWTPAGYRPVYAAALLGGAGYRYDWRRGHPYGYGGPSGYRGRYPSRRWCPFGR